MLRLCCLVPGRVVLCVAVCYAIHCCLPCATAVLCYTLHGTWGSRVCAPLIRGTCSVCTFCRELRLCHLCLDLSYCVHRYAVLPTVYYMGLAGMCATYFEERALCSVYTFCRVLRLCHLVSGRVVLCAPVCCATHGIEFGMACIQGGSVVEL